MSGDPPTRGSVRDPAHLRARPADPPTRGAGSPRNRLGTGLRVSRRHETAAASRGPGGAPSEPDRADEAAVERDGIVAVRDARARLREAATTGDDATIDRALRALLVVAVALRFGRTTVCAVAAAALEEGWPKLRRRETVARAARWSARARAIHDALTAGPSRAPGTRPPPAVSGSAAAARCTPGAP